MSDLILVTGASGFVGKWCVIKLLEKGYRVRGTIRSDAKAALVRKTVAEVVVQPPQRSLVVKGGTVVARDGELVRSEARTAA